jgi:hypothetical protein
VLPLNFERFPLGIELSSKRQQRGFALAEMVLVLPLFVFVAGGALHLSRQFHSGVALETARLNAALSANQIPPSLRRMSQWPRMKTSESGASLFRGNRPHEIFRSSLTSWLCQQPTVPPNLAQPTGKSINESELLIQLNIVRNRALNAQRASCLLEASARWGPQGSLAVLLSLSALPSESARRKSLLAFCPVTGRSGDLARQSVAAQGLGSSLFTVIPVRKNAVAGSAECD